MQSLEEIHTEQPFSIYPELSNNRLKLINQSKIEKYSWFLTDARGQMYLAGCETNSEVIIELPINCKGTYHLRAHGEVFELNVMLAS
jgi:hypothetical protein